MQRIAVLGLFVLLASGCTTTPPSDDIKNHILAISPDGKLTAPESLESNFRANRDAAPGSIEAIIDDIRTFQVPGKTTKVMLYIHGGLNTNDSAIGRAEKHSNDLKELGFYPVFINWRSGPFTTYGAHLSKIRQGEVAPAAKLTAPLYFTSDLARVVANAPIAWLTTGFHSVKSTLNRSYINSRNDDLDSHLGGKGRNNIYFVGNHQDASGIKRAAHWFASSPFKLVSTPFTYTLARPAWDVMLRRTNTPFIQTDEFADLPYALDKKSQSQGSVVVVS